MKIDFFGKENNLEVNLVSSTNSMTNLHYHNFYEIYYLASGEREYIIDGKIYKIFKGNIVLIKPNVIHMVYGTQYTRILIEFDKKYLENFFSESFIDILLKCFDNFYILNHNFSFKIKYLFEKMLTEYTTGNNCNVVVILSELLLKLNNIFESTQNTIIEPMPTDQNFAKILKHLTDNYSTINNINDIANKFFISKYHLCRLFKKNIGVTIITYLNEIKINQASILLKNTNKKITEVATLSGFNSISYFSKIFTDLTGMSPYEFRKLHCI